MALQLLPGAFAFETFLSETFLTAVGGGGRTANAVHTNAKTPSAWETFKLWVDPTTRISTPENPEGFFPYAIQTASGNYLTAVDGGGLSSSNVLHTDAKQAFAWEKFGLIPQIPPFAIYPQYYNLTKDSPWYYAIATEKGNYLTALGGGGRVHEPTLHTDARQIKSWELFRLISSGELSPGYQYAFRPLGGYTVAAVNGGGRPTVGLFMAAFDDPTRKPWAKFTLLRQDDGSYALQTLTGNYVTAVGGGGVGPFLSGAGGQESDVFHTDAVQVRSWEKFKIIDQGDFTYVLQTHFGWYVGLVTPPGGAQPIFRTDLTAVGGAAKFRLTPFFNAN
jgi:hypothetical protein